jgi:hypothetical protein
MRELFEAASKGVAKTSSINLLEIEPTQWATIVRRLSRYKLAEAMSSLVTSAMIEQEVKRRGGRGLTKDETRNLIASVYPDTFRVRLR